MSNFDLIIVIIALIIIIVLAICLVHYVNNHQKSDRKLIFTNYTDQQALLEIKNSKTGVIIQQIKVEVGQRFEYLYPGTSVDIMFNNQEQSINHVNFVLFNKHVKFSMYNSGSSTKFYENFEDTIDKTITLVFPEKLQFQAVNGSGTSTVTFDYTVFRKMYITINNIIHTLISRTSMKRFSVNTVTIENVPSEIENAECFVLSSDGIITYSDNLFDPVYVNEGGQLKVKVNTTLTYNLTTLNNEIFEDEPAYFIFNSNDLCSST